MKMIRKLAISLALVLLMTPLISAQDLSRYRKFALGTSLAALSKQIGQDPHQATVIHQNPAVIQELKYWPVETSYSAVPAEPVSQILFSFYNGELYRIAVTYDQSAIEGMTEDDMVRAVSARYGTGTRLYPEIDFPTHDQYAPLEKVVARLGRPAELGDPISCQQFGFIRPRGAFKTARCRSRGCHRRIGETGRATGASEGNRPSEKGSG